MTKIAAPEAFYFTFAEAKLMFGRQVDAEPCPGQRDHKEENAAGRAHILHHAADLTPTTQAVVQAVRIVGKRGRKARKLVLIDAYHRLEHWFSRDDCPFERILVIVHTIHADTADEELLRVDALARTIDSTEAVKKNSSRWCAAVRGAGLKATSKAYKVGLRSNSFFKRVLLNAKDSMLELTARARADLSAHEVLDRLFAQCERELKVSVTKEVFHAGVQTALFRGLQKLTDAELEKAHVQLGSLLTKLGSASSSKVHSLVVLSPTVERLYERITFLATPEKKKNMRALGNQEEFYNAVMADLKPLVEDFCVSLSAAKGKSRIRKV